MKILIVDDNPDILEGLRRSVPWEKIGFDTPFLAESALSAKNILEGYGVDMLITDIEMPGESGLELFDWVRERYPDVPCVFLTSHADFSYCQKAMRNGGFDYILQPAKAVDVESAVVKCRSYILNTRKNKALQEKGKEFDKVFRIAIKELCYSLFTKGQMFESQMEEWIVETDPRRELRGYLPAIFAVKGGASEIKEFTDEVTDRLIRECGYDGFASTDISDGVLGVVLFCRSEDTEDRWDHILTRIREESESRSDIRSALYVGLCSGKDLPWMVDRLETMRKNNVYKRPEIFRTEDEIAKLNVRDPDRDKWASWISSGDGILVKNQIANLIAYADRQGSLSLDYMQILYQNYTDALAGACHSAEFHFHDLFDGFYSVSQFESSYSYVETFLEAIDVTLKAFEKRKKDSSETSAMTMEERIHMVEKYIENNLSEQISRSDMAQRVFLSEDYFARIFKSISGSGFKEYVMQRKMEHAKTLLRETRFPVSVISSKVGYDNFSNFAQAFKKYTGMPPKEYRKNKDI